MTSSPWISKALKLYFPPSANRMLFIDEIDSHMHKNWIRFQAYGGRRMYIPVYYKYKGVK